MIMIGNNDIMIIIIMIVCDLIDYHLFGNNSYKKRVVDVEEGI